MQPVLQLASLLPALAGLVPTAPAQNVAYSAIATSGMSVGTPPSTSQSIPANTDVTAGASLQLGSGLTSAQLGLQLGYQNDELRVTLSGSTSNASQMTLLNSYAQAKVVTLSIQTAIPVRAIVSATFSATLKFPASVSLSVDAGAAGQFTYASQVTTMPPVTKTYPVLLTPQGFTLRIGGEFYASWGMGLIGASSGTLSLVVRADPDYPLRAVPFGTRCGAALVASTDLNHLGATLFTLTAQQQPIAAWYLLGDQRLAIPLPFGCTLYDNVVVLLPAALDMNGVASVRVVPPPIPGLYVVLQGGTWDGSTLQTSEGLELFGG